VETVKSWFGEGESKPLEFTTPAKDKFGDDIEAESAYLLRQPEDNSRRDGPGA